MSLLIYHPDIRHFGAPDEQLNRGEIPASAASAASAANTAAVVLSAAASRHVQVLRKQPGDTIRLFDGRGTIHTASIRQIGRKEVTAAIIATSCQPLPPAGITLLAGLTAGNRMDWLVEKTTELGATHIQPVLLQRSVVRLPALSDNGSENSRSAKKRKQWEQIAIAACEQSGRSWLPAIAPVRTLMQALHSQHKQTSHDRAAATATATGSNTAAPQTNNTGFGFEGGSQSISSGAENTADTAAPLRCLLSLHPDSQPINSLIKPDTRHFVFASAGEGGFTPDEEKLLIQSGYLRTSLGTAVLRAETAPVAAICMAHALSSPHRR